MKKYLYAGVLFGTVMLAGCNEDEGAQGQINEEMTEGLTDADKSEVVPAVLLELTQEQKVEYYKQYEEIVNEINSGEPIATLELGPFETYTHYIEPSEFEKYAIERSNWEFTSEAFGGDSVE